MRLQSQADHRRQAAAQVHTVLHLLHALRAVAVVIAVFGVVKTVAVSVLERTCEMGLLRAVGITWRQLRRLIRLDPVLVATHGAVLGLALDPALGPALGLGWASRAAMVLTAYGTTLTFRLDYHRYPSSSAPPSSAWSQPSGPPSAPRG